jgi:hypothetical protein
MNVVTPPHPFEKAPRPLVFLAGSIEAGTAPLWQDALAELLTRREGTLLNPRRAAWDASWKQELANPLFREQVEWELAGQEAADRILMYFAPQTRSPITLLELGLFARSGRLTVCCPPGFWRRGNVEVVCRRYGVSMVEGLAELGASIP